MTAPILTSDRILLRPYRLSDFDRLAEIYRSPRAAYIGGLRSVDKVWRDFAADVGQWSLLGFGCWSIEDRASGACLGQTGLNFPPEYPEREIGWVLWEEFEGKGYAFEAAKLALGYAFETLKFETLVSYIDPENTRSIRLAEKLGAARDDGAARPEGDGCLVYRHANKL
jgi:RimJ/RimL family protein N-acetyltransferase